MSEHHRTCTDPFRTSQGIMRFAQLEYSLIKLKYRLVVERISSLTSLITNSTTFIYGRRLPFNEHSLVQFVCSGACKQYKHSQQ